MRWTLLVALSAMTACQFDGTGATAADATVPDAAAPIIDGGDPAPADAAPCPEPLAISVTVNGHPYEAGATGPLARVAIGDVITVDASGTCSQAGAITNYQFTVEPTPAIAHRTVSGATVRFYAQVPGSVNVAVAVTDSVGQTANVARFYAVEVTGWRRVTHPTVTGLDIHALAAGDGTLWLGATTGAFALELSDFAACSADIACNLAGELGGDDPGDVHAILYDSSRKLLWAGGKDGVFRGKAGPPASPFVHLGVPDGAKDDIRDLAADGDGGVWAATPAGAWTAAADAGSFTVGRSGLDSFAVTTAGSRVWLGGAALTDIVSDTTRDVFAGDDKIRALFYFAPANKLWIGSDAAGIVRAGIDGTVEDTFSTATGDGLQSDRIRDVLVTADDGDVWAATDVGIARWSETFAEWIPMQSPQGLTESDTRAVAVAVVDGIRTIYAGTKSGLFYLRAE
ncbi:MAG TPA: hypothetical protein VFG83_14250 [Kofleriaceae bacterium]|nr:hypothetical protein [Kofleriaceae bacterium]